MQAIAKRNGSTILERMPKKGGKKVKPPKTTPFTMRLPDALRAKLNTLAERNFSDITAEIVAAIIDRLRANKLWPREGETQDKDKAD